MKYTYNKKIDRIALLRKDPNFIKASEETDFFIRLAVAINEARKSKNWTQQELAKKVGTTQKIVSKVENGDINIGSNLLQRFARALNKKLQLGDELLVKDEIEAQVRKVNNAENIPSPFFENLLFNFKHDKDDVSQDTINDAKIGEMIMPTTTSIDDKQFLESPSIRLIKQIA